MMIKIFSLVSFMVLVGSKALSAPAQIFIIRHAEKPPVGSDLSPQGAQRAAGMPAFFENTPQLKQFGTPVAIYAMEAKSTDSSNRPVETVTPLANALGVPINSSFTKLQIAPMVSQIMNNRLYNNKTVLICWEHDMIPLIASDLGATSAPQVWNGTIFNQVWILTYTGNMVTSFNILQEKILPSDPSF